MKLKKKIYPSPSPSSSSSSSSSAASVGKDYLTVLKLLPAAILALASVLSAEDAEVLAYMITRSLQTTTTNPSSIFLDSKKKSSKKTLISSGATGNSKANGARHKPPVFDCDCFDCYTSYWLRWDSSPNRERIHQVIEAFEDHLTNGETKKSKSSRAKKGRRSADSLSLELPGEAEPIISSISVISSPEQLHPPVVPAPLPILVDDAPISEKATEEQVSEVADMTGEFQAETDEEAADARTAAAASDHKGLARKVLPDVLGLFNSRLWNLWSPNV